MIEAMLAVSFHPGTAPHERSRLRSRAEAALTVLGRHHPTAVVDRDGLLVLVSGIPSDDATRPMVLGEPTPVVDGSPLAPAASFWLDGDALRVRSDPLGFRHISLHESPIGAVVSSSALAVGATLGLELDPSSWGALATIGYLLEDSTLFAGVERLPGDREAVLTDGHLDCRDLPPPASRTEPRDGATAVRDAVGACLAFAPDAALELSGGLDSRMILAAIPAERRRDRTALTLGRASSPDVTVASRIARTYGLDHRILDPTPSPTAGGDQLLTDVIRAARRLEHASDPAAAYALSLVESRLPQGPRFSGVNGEAARGTFYPGSGSSGDITRERVVRLAQWRLFPNARVDASLFASGWLADQQAQTVDRITAILQATQLPWKPATDVYRRTQRMRNWAGLNYSAAATHRSVLAPFLHPGFLAWADTLPVHERAGSRGFARSMTALDPSLARMPLDSGLRPDQLFAGGLPSRVARGRQLAGKVARKVVQRVRHDRRPPSGAATLVEPLRTALADVDLGARLPAVPWLDPPAIERVVATPGGVDQPTVGLLVNLLGVQAFLDAVDRGAASAPKVP